VSYEDRTRDELRDELKQRDLPVSGSKEELIERLEDADREQEGDTEGDGSGSSGDAGGSTSGGSADGRSEGSDGDRSSSAGRSGGLKPMQLVRLAGAQLMQLTGRDVDGTSGIERTEEGWRVLFEIVEVTRVPRAMDLLGLYEVIVDEDGDLVRYERIRRYGRTQAEDSE
jgi:hypothetical protein